VAQKRITCWQCPRYDREARHCLDGKANPVKKSDTVEVAEALGLQKICLYNPYRDDLAMRTYFPRHPLAQSPAKPRRKPRVKVEVELEGEVETEEALALLVKRKSS